MRRGTLALRQRLEPFLKNRGHANGVPFAFERDFNASELVTRQKLVAAYVRRREASLRVMLLKAFSGIRDSQATYPNPERC